ncbi:hypothetical protein TrVE_jg5981 [Triparma verrucosa]|uniref:PAP/OAS1 substrate-binding-related domain-containing protein n=1 Tax=Triparma verrucosa TaxID=1606542 RepID=A0A9W7BGI4_9STRA|nr:hypothetical protein TrVE_jg5981 [Triparma verrucosa]
MSVLKSQIEHNFLGVGVMCVGSMACGTDVPGSDVDLTVVVPPDLIAEAGGAGNFLTSILYFLTCLSTNENSDLSLRGPRIESVKLLAKTRYPIIRAEINGTQADISINKINAVAATAFLCNTFRRQNGSPLAQTKDFLSTCIKAIKSWAMNESAKYVNQTVIGARENMFSSYCYSIMVLALFSQKSPTTLVEFFEEFFKYYSEFDWERQCLTVKGGIAHLMLPSKPSEPVVDTNAEPTSATADFNANLDAELYLYKDFGRKVLEGSSWIHVQGANVQDPINFGNNISKGVSEESLKKTILAFKFGLQHLALIRKYGNLTNEADGIFSMKSASQAPWELARHFPFLWPSYLIEDPSKTADDFNPLEKYNEFKEFVNMQSSSPVGTSNNLKAPPGKFLCPFCWKKISGKEKQEEHLKSHHWVTLSFLPQQRLHEILFRGQTFVKDIEDISRADACPVFLFDTQQNESPRESVEAEWGAGFINGGLTTFLGKEGGVGRRISDLAPPSPQADVVSRKSPFESTPPTTPKHRSAGVNGLSGLTVDVTRRSRIDSFNSDSAPSSPMTPQQGMGSKKRRKRNRKKKGFIGNDCILRPLLCHEDMFINIKMMIHVCRLAGHPHVFLDFKEDDLTIGTNKKGRKKNRNRMNSKGDFDKSSSIGTIDSLDFQGLQVWDRLGRDVDQTMEQDEHQYETADEVKAQSSGRKLLAAPSGEDLEYEDYTARRKSLGESGNEEDIKKATSRVPTNTSPAMSWADRVNPYAERKALTSAEITVAGVIIRARLISEEFQEVVDPALKDREAQKQLAKGNDGDGWFKETKKRIMWVLNVQDHNYNIVLFHSTISGKKSISINGTCLAVKSKALVDFGGKFKFKLGWIKMLISVESKLSGNFRYKLCMDGLKDPILTC